MTVSPRLTHAALTFLFFGTVAALLPSQDTAAMADNECTVSSPEGTSQFAVAPAISDIRNAYALTPTAATYYFYYKSSDTNSYSRLPAPTTVSTNFEVTSGQVNINGATYTTGGPNTNSSAPFTMTQSGIRDFKGKVTYVPGSATATSIYSMQDPHNSTLITTYKINLTFSTL